MATFIPDLTTDVNADSAPVALYGNDTMTQLALVLDELRVNEKYNTPPEKLDRAYDACLEGRVHPTTTPGLYQVESAQKAEGHYDTHDGICTCKYATTRPQERYDCRHSVAAVMYARWQQNVAPLGAPLPSHATREIPSMPLEASTMDEETTSPMPAPFPLALPLRPIAAIINDLSKPLPQECLGRFQRKGVTIYFVPWPTVAAILDTYAPGWEGAITRVEKVGDKLAVFYRLTIHALEGEFSQEDGGMEDEDQNDYGDAVTNATATAMKRTAAKFGVGRDLYTKAVTAAPLAAYLKAERVAALAALGKAVDHAGLEREATIAWLRTQTGAATNATLPLAAIHALTCHLDGR